MSLQGVGLLEEGAEGRGKYALAVKEDSSPLVVLSKAGELGALGMSIGMVKKGDEQRARLFRDANFRLGTSCNDWAA